MRYLPILTLLLAGAAILVGQAPPESCCQLRLSSEAKTPGVLAAKVTNMNQPLVTVHETSAEADLRVRVTSETGREVERTPYGKRLLTRERGGRMLLRELRAGESVSQELDIRRLFQLTSGAYGVTVVRDVIIGETRVPVRASITIRLP